MSDGKKSVNEITYELINPLKYHSKGGTEEEAKFITMAAPTMRHLEYREPLMQALCRAVMEMSADNEKTPAEIQKERSTKEPEELEVTGKEILSMMRAATKVDMTKVQQGFIKLVTSRDIGMVEGDTPLTTKLVDDLDVQDFDGMMGDYIANFIYASLSD